MKIWFLKNPIGNKIPKVPVRHSKNPTIFPIKKSFFSWDLFLNDKYLTWQVKYTNNKNVYKLFKQWFIICHLIFFSKYASLTDVKMPPWHLHSYHQHNVKSFDEIFPVSIFPPKVRFMYIMYVSFNVILIMATISNSVLYVFVIKNLILFIFFFFYFKLTTYGREQKLFIIIDDI